MAEIKTCEQYVLAVLDTREKQVDSLTEQLDTVIKSTQDIINEYARVREILQKYGIITHMHSGEHSICDCIVMEVPHSEECVKDFEFLNSVIGFKGEYE